MEINLNAMTQEQKENLASDPNTAEEVLRQLAKDDYWNVRYPLALNPNIPVGLLRDFVRDGDNRLKRFVASNPNTPEDILRKLAVNKDSLVRYYVAGNPNASSNLLVMLFGYEKSLKEPSVNVMIALHKHDKLPYVAKVILETLFGKWL